jgi:hypothetical protein
MPGSPPMCSKAERRREEIEAAGVLKASLRGQRVRTWIYRKGAHERDHPMLHLIYLRKGEFKEVMPWPQDRIPGGNQQINRYLSS